jgi:hypothetical protein
MNHDTHGHDHESAVAAIGGPTRPCFAFAAPLRLAERGEPLRPGQAGPKGPFPPLAAVGAAQAKPLLAWQRPQNSSSLSLHSKQAPSRAVGSASGSAVGAAPGAGVPGQGGAGGGQRGGPEPRAARPLHPMWAAAAARLEAQPFQAPRRLQVGLVAAAGGRTAADFPLFDGDDFLPAARPSPPAAGHPAPLRPSAGRPPRGMTGHWVPIRQPLIGSGARRIRGWLETLRFRVAVWRS